MNGAAVLVVDDEAGMRETLADILEGRGYHVAAARDGDEALDAMRQRSFDVVVMDIRMPGRDGVEIAQEMGDPPPRVIMMTAYAMEDRLRQAVEGNTFALVFKPFDIAHLLGLVAGAAQAGP